MAIPGSAIRLNPPISPCLKTTRLSHGARKQFYSKASAGSPNGEEGKMMIRKEKDGWKIDFSGEKPPTPLLDTINYPVHMKNLSTEDLEQLAAELRADIVYTVAKVGGHLSASLGVVDLSVALHHVFNTPEDRIIWDVGHQAYPHKILTGRRSKMHTIRKTSGLAGFPKRDESIYDAFGAGHSSTSISAGLGMAVGRDLLGKNNNVICVIGDGAMTAGQAYEAMNNAGFLDSNLIVVLNDNNQVSLPTATLDGPATPVGALSGALSKLQSSTKFRKLREAAKSITKQIGSQAHEVAAKVDEYARGMLSAPGSTLFEELGLYYIGPVDGHNLEDLVTIFEKVKSMPVPGPVLIHIVTEKGKGYPPAEAAADKMHGVVKFDPETGKQSKPKSSTLSYTQYFAEALIKEAEVDNKIVAIHAAMGSGTGLNYFQKKFPDRCFDVGIAEQHAVTFAAGLATEGLKPFCAIYSSFLQRGYDQVVHDVDLQKLPVRFAMDRAGLVGADGPTHCGAFDIAYMACLPNMVVMAPSDEAELIHIVATAAAIDDRPSCFRFPRGNGVGAVLPFNNKGMGEPLHNIDNVIKATEIMVHDQGLHFSPRKVTVSTSGLVPQLKRFLRESNCALAVSLNATTDAARNWIMPINRKYNLTLLLKTLREELNLKRNYKVIFEYVMLAGVNDSIEDAIRLIDLVQGIPCKINLITFNPHSGSQFKLTREEKMTEFRNLLAEAGCVVFLRPSRGTIKWLPVVSLASCTNTSNGCL